MSEVVETEETVPPAASETSMLATVSEPIQIEQSEQTKKKPNSQISSLDLDKVQATDFSSPESNELESIREKINNPKLRQSHETKSYLKSQEKLLLKNQKLLAEKKVAESKIECWKAELSNKEMKQKNYLLAFAGSGLILIGGMSFLGYRFFKSKKYHGKRK